MHDVVRAALEGTLHSLAARISDEHTAAKRFESDLADTHKVIADLEARKSAISAALAAGDVAPAPATLTDAQVKHMVERFLMWKLPADFNPDGGISFDRLDSHLMPRQPIGTNLLTATQAKAMIRHLLDGLPPAAPADAAAAEAMAEQHFRIP